jgi:hypothetical protein
LRGNSFINFEWLFAQVAEVQSGMSLDIEEVEPAHRYRVALYITKDPAQFGVRSPCAWTSGGWKVTAFKLDHVVRGDHAAATAAASAAAAPRGRWRWDPHHISHFDVEWADKPGFRSTRGRVSYGGTSPPSH